MDLGNLRLDLLDQQLARPLDRHGVARLKNRIGVGIDQLVAAPDPLDEDAQAREELAHRPAGEPAGRVDAVGSQLDVRDRRT